MDHTIRKPLSGGPLLTVSSPPFWHCGRTLNGLMLDMLAALLPAAAMAVYYYGLPAARVMALACLVAIITETLCCKWMRRTVSVNDFSAVVTGLLFAFMLPASAPWWLTAMGAALTIVMGKMIFGGLGGAPLPAPIIGWAICTVSWPDFMNVDTTMLGSELINPLSQLKYLGLDSTFRFTDMALLKGAQLGGLGSSQVLALLVGGVYLAVRRRIKWIIPVAFLAGVALVSLVFRMSDPETYAPPLFHLLSGMTVFAAFFLATDHSSSPVTRYAMIFYGLLGGALVIILRVWGAHYDGATWAVMLVALFTPILDRIRPKPLGYRKGGAS